MKPEIAVGEAAESSAPAPRPGGEAGAGGDLGPHAPGGEVALGEQRQGPAGPDAPHRRVAGGAVAGVGAGHVGEDGEEVGLQGVGQQRRGEVLVHHRLHPCKLIGDGLARIVNGQVMARRHRLNHLLLPDGIDGL